MPKAKWFDFAGPESDVVISTRIRLARNIRGLAFPGRMTEGQRQALGREVEALLTSAALGDIRRISTKTTSPVEIASLVEQHSASTVFQKLPNGLLFIADGNPRQEIGVMICEEDHIRLQVMQAGLCLREAYATAKALDDLLDSRFDYAFDEELGFLTRCPTNLGTGLRASAMLHLPALEKLGYLARIESSLSKLGLTIRGTYGEGSGGIGAMYQVSNQITLGISEEDAIQNLSAIVGQIIAQERELRRKLMENDEFIDQVHRAHGILRSARILSAGEFYQLMSLLRVGVSMGEIGGCSLEQADWLIFRMGAATLLLSDASLGDPSLRDKTRATLVRHYMLDEIGA